MKKITVGMLAHVDAGKTTLAESLLYLGGAIRRLGRVDNRDTFLDTHELERARGITIFSKQAVFSWGGMEVTLLDTPGHVDFSAEMERTLRVLDYGVLVVSGPDGVQGHTLTLWRLLERYGIPVFIFVNKMDQAGTARQALMDVLRKRLGEGVVDFSPGRDRERFLEDLAVCDEELLERYLETGTVERGEIAGLVRTRRAFPCYFGSALRLEGVEDLLDGLSWYAVPPSFPDGFGALVYKIGRDDQGGRLTWLRVTGGSLKVKDTVANRPQDTQPGDGSGKEFWEEKVNQIRIYSGSRYEAVDEAAAGTVCAVTGLGRTYPGQGLGAQRDFGHPFLEPVLSCQICLPAGCDVHGMLGKLRQLEEEDPQLHIVWDGRLEEIHVQVMGEVQLEVLRSLIQERFGVEVEFGSGSILYKETICGPAEGVGHFEPLRHYAEVHLLMEPGERGSGLCFSARCSEDALDRNWQRLILTHLAEREHLGVLTGSPITDMRITLVAGKAHTKHTEGGDFREATYRAVRQGLCKAGCALLEPYYEFRLEVPSEHVGRAMTDIQRMCGEFAPPQTDGEESVLTGSAPAAAMRGYQAEVTAYTHGRGRLSCEWKGYGPCHNEAEVVEEAGYDRDADLENPCGSVFCSHGAGYVVPWDQVEAHMHLPPTPIPEAGAVLSGREAGGPGAKPSPEPDLAGGRLDEELEAIFNRSLSSNRKPEKQAGQGAPRRSIEPRPSDAPSGHRDKKKAPGKGRSESYLLVDGYNIIFAWEELKSLAEADLGAARGKLMDILCNYQAYERCTLILVFDAYKVEGGTESVTAYHNIHVVYTRESETADQYIEKVAHRIGREKEVTVATSDALEQVIIRGQGCRLLSAGGLLEEVERACREMRSEYLGRPDDAARNYLFDHLEEDLAGYLQKVRMGEEGV